MKGIISLLAILLLCEVQNVAGAGKVPVLKSFEFWAPPSGIPGPDVAISKTWSPADYRDSIIVRAVVDAGETARDKVLLLASVQILAGRRVWTDKDHEIVDPDRTSQRAVWLPSSISVELPLSKSRAGPNGLQILDVGVVMPERFLIKLRAYDPELSVVALRVTGRLMARGAPFGPSTISRQIDLAIGD